MGPPVLFSKPYGVFRIHVDSSDGRVLDGVSEVEVVRFVGMVCWQKSILRRCEYYFFPRFERLVPERHKITLGLKRSKQVSQVWSPHGIGSYSRSINQVLLRGFVVDALSFSSGAKQSFLLVLRNDCTIVKSHISALQKRDSIYQ
jgi:hypothetical protein